MTRLGERNTDRLASFRACLRASLPPRQTLTSFAASDSMAKRDAISPAAWPPIPSATAKIGGRARKLSSIVVSDTSPVGRGAEHGRADLHHHLRCLDLHPTKDRCRRRLVSTH